MPNVLPVRLASALVASLRKDKCGCATSALCLGVALLASVFWYAWPGNAAGLSAAALALRVLGFAMLAAFAGKLVALLAHRRMSRAARR